LEALLELDEFDVFVSFVDYIILSNTYNKILDEAVTEEFNAAISAV